MYRKVAAILFPITVIALIGTAVWGYHESQDKNSVLIKAENQYQRAFHELNDHFSKLQNEMGKSLVLNSRDQMATSMTNIWRLAYAAQSDLGQLPLTLMPFDKTENFVSNMGHFAYQVGVRDLTKHPLTQKERNTLQVLYDHSKSIKNDLTKVQSQVLDKHLRWMDVELALATEDKTMDHSIIDGFKKVNQMVGHYPEVDWGPNINNMEVKKREKYKRLKGEKITPEQAKKRVAKALGRPSTEKMIVTDNNKLRDYQTYSIRYPKNKSEVYADITKIGGYMVWMVYDRPVKKSNLSFSQAKDRALRFLNRIGYSNMTPISYDETGHIVTINFVHKEKGVFIYPEAVTVKVALDNGEITGLRANEYIFNKMNRIKQKPLLSKANARKKISPRLKVEKSNLAVIYNEIGDEVLCYEFLGKLNSEQYRVFINANNGKEEHIEKIEKADTSQI
jgi:spore germination protein